MGDIIVNPIDDDIDSVAQFKAEGLLNEQMLRDRANNIIGVEEAAFSGFQNDIAFLNIVAEGDSWFDYILGTDIIDCLRRNHNCIVDKFANAGDTLENMIYGTMVERGYRPAESSIKLVLQRLRHLQPPIFLFSGGGNDIVGDPFGTFLNHQESGLPIFRQRYAEHMVQTVFRQYLEDLIKNVLDVAPSTHIVMHGYGYALPSGDGAGLFGIDFRGPWLLPAFAMKRITNPTEQRMAINTLIDLYNDLLKDLAQKHDQFHYVNLRPIIVDDDWADELHLKNKAFARVASAINDVMRAI